MQRIFKENPFGPTKGEEGIVISAPSSDNSSPVTPSAPSASLPKSMSLQVFPASGPSEKEPGREELEMTNLNKESPEGEITGTSDKLTVPGKPRSSLQRGNSLRMLRAFSPSASNAHNRRSVYSNDFFFFFFFSSQVKWN